MMSAGFNPNRGDKVISLKRSSAVATGKSRQLASLAIMRRLRQLVGFAHFQDGDHGLLADLFVGSLVVCLHKTPWGMYFRVDGPGCGPLLMSGYLDPEGGGKHAGGEMHVMSWRRGWEAGLFAQEPIARLRAAPTS